MAVQTIKQGGVGASPTDAYFTLDYDDATFRISRVSLVNNHDTLTVRVIARNEPERQELSATCPPNSTRNFNIPGGQNYYFTDEAWGYSAGFVAG